MLDVDGGGSLSQEKLLRDLWILCCHGAMGKTPGLDEKD